MWKLFAIAGLCIASGAWAAPPATQAQATLGNFSFVVTDLDVDDGVTAGYSYVATQGIPVAVAEANLLRIQNEGVPGMFGDVSASISSPSVSLHSSIEGQTFSSNALATDVGIRFLTGAVLHPILGPPTYDALPNIYLTPHSKLTISADAHVFAASACCEPGVGFATATSSMRWLDLNGQPASFENLLQVRVGGSSSSSQASADQTVSIELVNDRDSQGLFFF